MNLKNIDHDINNINYNQIRNILKKLKYNKLSEQIPHLINVLSGVKAPTLDRAFENKSLRSLFKEIQIPFMKNCPPTRKNFYHTHMFYINFVNY